MLWFSVRVRAGPPFHQFEIIPAAVLKLPRLQESCARHGQPVAEPLCGKFSRSLCGRRLESGATADVDRRTRHYRRLPLQIQSTPAAQPVGPSKPGPVRGTTQSIPGTGRDTPTCLHPAVPISANPGDEWVCLRHSFIVSCHPPPSDFTKVAAATSCWPRNCTVLNSTFNSVLSAVATSRYVISPSR